MYRSVAIFNRTIECLAALVWCKLVTLEETFEQLIRLWKDWLAVEARFDSSCFTLLLNVEKAAKLWPQQRAGAGTPGNCHYHFEPMQWLHLNVFNKECVSVCALPRGQRSGDGKVYRVTPALGAAQQALNSGVRGLRIDPDAGDASEVGWTDPRGERHAYERLSSQNVVWVGADELNGARGTAT